MNLFVKCNIYLKKYFLATRSALLLNICTTFNHIKNKKTMLKQVAISAVTAILVLVVAVQINSARVKKGKKTMF